MPNVLLEQFIETPITTIRFRKPFDANSGEKWRFESRRHDPRDDNLEYYCTHLQNILGPCTSKQARVGATEAERQDVKPLSTDACKGTVWVILPYITTIPIIWSAFGARGETLTLTI
jgi:hypothetical protein